MTNARTLWRSIIILALVGIALASYLYYSYLFQPAFQPCYINARVNCQAVINGPIAQTLGLPTALYGLIGYICILVFAIWRKPKLVLVVATFGLLFCLRITYLEIFVLKVICPVCLTCQIVMVAIFGLAAWLVIMGRYTPHPKKSDALDKGYEIDR